MLVLPNTSVQRVFYSNVLCKAGICIYHALGMMVCLHDQWA